MPTLKKAKSAKEERGISAGKRVEAHLRKAVFAGKLLPRQRIIEEDLARELKVSRGPVREALLRLERDGLVVITSRRGTFIRDVSQSEIKVIFGIRGKLEGLCVRYMRENPSLDSAALVNPWLKKMKAAVAKKADEQFFRADMELHHAIWKASNQPLLYRMLNLLMNPFMFMIARAYSSRVEIAKRLENHEQYLRIVLKTPIPKIEEEVERYFNNHYPMLFGQHSHFQAFASEEWTDGIG